MAAIAEAPQIALPAAIRIASEGSTPSMRASSDREQHRDDDDPDGDGDPADAEPRDGVQRDAQPEQGHARAQERPRRERDAGSRGGPAHGERREQHPEAHREDQRADLGDRAVQEDPGPDHAAGEREPRKQAGDPVHASSVALAERHSRKDPPSVIPKWNHSLDDRAAGSPLGP